MEGAREDVRLKFTKLLQSSGVAKGSQRVNRSITATRDPTLMFCHG